MTCCLVPPHMYFECTRSHKSLATLSAFKGSVAWVAPQMVSQMTLSRKSLFTTGNAAHKGLLAWVDPEVSLKVALLSESFSARLNWALKRFLSGLIFALNFCAYMSPQMNLQAPRPWVSFGAHMANVGFVPGVDELMGLQMSFCDELLLARPVTAYKGPFSSLQNSRYLSHW